MSPIEKARQRPGSPGKSPASSPLIVRTLGCIPYGVAWKAMRAFNEGRDADSADELWLLEHPSVFTLGRAASSRHLLAPGDIPVIQSDRGGQTTWHGPGQLVAYLLCDLRRAGSGVRRIVESLEQAVIDMLESVSIRARRRLGAPGVYVEESKIAAVGLRVSRNCTSHGVAINVDADLEPFSRIDPCGYPDLRVTRLVDLGVGWSVDETKRHFARFLAAQLGREIRQGSAKLPCALGSPPF
ncbi:lipoyl(octanoyl) transferase LipB [Thioalkalivibrio sp. HK1]|uniref:lipoyl(octanoyl) transferase LipB n=1 Tax=Thioalkalivibrio sp. HK1 TaxID=1469245 RepID=UPI00047062E9|nr:lipoyl(octanoyl) transferase LipB [Thioalkalivibrio sp. HK1]